jgi:hypothetical protein
MSLQPLEFVRLTPMTNCGQCGYPACLAFAAAVTKGGEDPGKCPHIDPAQLAGQLSSADSGERGGLERVDQLLQQKDLALVECLRAKAARLDFKAVANPLGCVWLGPDRDALGFRCLGRDVVLAHLRVELDGTPAEDPRDQILLYNYVHFGGGSGVPGPWVGMESLPNSIAKIRTLKVYSEDRIAAGFSGQVEALQRAAAAIDGVVDESMAGSCSVALQIPVLPRLILLVIFWDAELDDGFPARCKILFAQNVLDVLDIESLVFASERTAERLMECA